MGKNFVPQANLLGCEGMTRAGGGWAWGSGKGAERNGRAHRAGLCGKWRSPRVGRDSETSVGGDPPAIRRTKKEKQKRNEHLGGIGWGEHVNSRECVGLRLRVLTQAVAVWVPCPRPGQVARLREVGPEQEIQRRVLPAATCPFPSFRPLPGSGAWPGKMRWAGGGALPVRLHPVLK